MGDQLIDRPGSPLVASETPGKRPATHRCFACGAKVNMEQDDDDQHVCVLDPAGPITARGQKWRATNAKAAREAREQKVNGGGR